MVEGLVSDKAKNFAIELIKEGEGFREAVYTCSQGYPTIGIGHKLLNHEKGVLKKVTL